MSYNKGMLNKKGDNMNIKFCEACGENPNITGHPLQRDHIKPQYEHGSNEEHNIQMLCSVCNRSKGTDNYDWRGTFDRPNEYHVIQKKKVKAFHDARNFNKRRGSNTVNIPSHLTKGQEVEKATQNEHLANLVASL